MDDGLKLTDFGYLDWGPITLALPVGEIGGLSGASGSGKSLLLRATADLIESTGELCWRELRCIDIPAPQWRQRVGLLPANPVWWFDHVGQHFHGNVTQWLTRLGFEADVLKWEVGRLSSGEKQRLALVRLFDRNPECLLLDEPTANLDDASAERVVAAIRDYLEEAGAIRAVLLVSHDGALLNQISARQWRMKGHQLQPFEPAS